MEERLEIQRWFSMAAWDHRQIKLLHMEDMGHLKRSDFKTQRIGLILHVFTLLTIIFQRMPHAFDYF